MTHPIKRLLWCLCIGIGFGGYGAQIGTAQSFSLPGYLPSDCYPSYWSAAPACNSCYSVNSLPPSCDSCESRGCNSSPAEGAQNELDCVKNPNDPRCKVGNCCKGCSPGYGAPAYVPQRSPETRRITPRSALTKSSNPRNDFIEVVVRRRQAAPLAVNRGIANRFPENESWIPVVETKTASR